MALSPNIFLMEEAARQAGESLLQDFAQRDALHVQTKKPGDFVSEADHRSEKIIADILRGAYPAWGILGEEGTDLAADAQGYRWIIDPLDGTTNFLHGIPHWCVTIALEKNAEIIAGVVFDPLRQELFTAEKDKGAFLNNKKISVSQRHNFAEAIVAMGINSDDERELAAFSNMFAKAYLACANVLTASSTVLDLAYVAAGRLESSYSKNGSKPWDMAAGLLLIHEAGGIITHHDMQPATIYKDEVLAGNKTIHQKFAKLIGLY